ncbi:MAG: MFS transporter [Gammaproteobacteria bacterium 39-13]|nr:MFS transporter [Gammaproteobacteria bacterium]OJV96278.1 MAG: MFS transporter [Gammaproteobacteria bacterium 39-13]
MDFLKPAPYQPIVKNQTEIDGDYRYWRIRICYSIFLGYALFYFTRKSFTFAMPYMSADLGLSKGELGLLASILYISYGISKFISGVMSDRSNPRYFMATGLIITGILNILFGFSSTLWVFALFWGLNGWFQAWGWPACCKQLNYWFDQSERGLWYSICSTSHNLGGALIPLLAVFCAVNFGWRYAMFVPAVCSIIMGFILINRLRDVPRTLGLPTVEEFKNKIIEPSESQETKHSLLSVSEILFKQVLNNKYVWIFSISYFFVYVVRTAINDWTFFYLTEAKNMEDMLASSGVFWFEVGGFVGMIAAGWGSDYFWKGNRVPAMVVCSLGLIFALLGLKYVPADHVFLDMLLLALIGAFVFGPQMIVGLAAAEFVDKRAAATSNGFAGTLGYFGAAVAGYPVGKMIDAWGWHGFFIALLISSALILVMLLPLWSSTDKKDKTTDEKGKMEWAPKTTLKET